MLHLYAVYFKVFIPGNEKEIQKSEVLARMCRNWNPHILSVGILSGKGTRQNSAVIPQKVKHKITI